MDSAYVTYWSLRDPLCLSQSLPVVRALAARGWEMGLVTFEQPAWRLAPDEQKSTQAALAREGVTWLPLDYHKRPPVLSTIFDITRGALRLHRLARGQGARLLHSRGSVPAAMTLAAARTSGAAFFYDADGPLSQEYVDAGIWGPRSWAFRLARTVEARSLESADRVAVLSTLRQQEVQPRVRGSVAVLPCGIDTVRFVRDDLQRDSLRRQLGLSGTVLAYVGKSGGWYLIEPMLDFVQAVSGLRPPTTLLVCTADPPAAFLDAAAARNVRCVVRPASPAEIPHYLSAADAGLSFRRPSPSQSASSPIKNAEYLACGLPVVSSSVAGDYPDLLRRERVGIVVPDFDGTSLASAASALVDLLGDPALGERCRSLAVRTLDLQRVVVPRYVEIYRELLGEPRPGSRR